MAPKVGSTCYELEFRLEGKASSTEQYEDNPFVSMTSGHLISDLDLTF